MVDVGLLFWLLTGTAEMRPSTRREWPPKRVFIELTRFRPTSRSEMFWPVLVRFDFDVKRYSNTKKKKTMTLELET